MSPAPVPGALPTALSSVTGEHWGCCLPSCTQKPKGWWNTTVTAALWLHLLVIWIKVSFSSIRSLLVPTNKTRGWTRSSNTRGRTGKKSKWIKKLVSVFRWGWSKYRRKDQIYSQLSSWSLSFGWDKAKIWMQRALDVAPLLLVWSPSDALQSSVSIDSACFPQGTGEIEQVLPFFSYFRIYSFPAKLLTIPIFLKSLKKKKKVVCGANGMEWAKALCHF